MLPRETFKLIFKFLRCTGGKDCTEEKRKGSREGKKAKGQEGKRGQRRRCG